MVIDIVCRSPDHFPSGTLAALESSVRYPHADQQPADAVPHNLRHGNKRQPRRIFGDHDYLNTRSGAENLLGEIRLLII
jgi:hypothetical protein